MASPEAMEKLRAVLDYAPEEALRRLPGDPQETYDALTRRLHRTVAVKSMVRRKVIVERPELAEDVEPEGPAWTPPLPPEPAPPFAEPEQRAAAEDLAAGTQAEGVWEPSAEASSVLEAREPEEGDEEFFDIGQGAPGVEMEPVEPDVSLSESEWRTLEQASVPEEEAEAPIVAGEGPQQPVAPEEDEAFEEVALPPEGEVAPEAWAPEAPEQGVVEGELEPGVAEFEIEETSEVSEAGDFEVLEEEEAEVEEGLEPPYQVNEYTLFRRTARTKGGRARTSYFFSTEPSVGGAQPSALPEGYEVLVNPTTGIPVVRRGMARTLPVIEIEGLGPLMAERLEQAGVRTTRDLLRVDPRAISEETGISERLLGNFVAMANLLQMPGLYPDQAAAMVYAGVRNLEELKRATPVDLAKAVNAAAKDHQLKLRGKMTPSRLRAWQEKIAKLQPE